MAAMTGWCAMDTVVCQVSQGGADGRAELMNILPRAPLMILAGCLCVSWGSVRRASGTCLLESRPISLDGQRPELDSESRCIILNFTLRAVLVADHADAGAISPVVEVAGVLSVAGSGTQLNESSEP